VEFDSRAQKRIICKEKRWKQERKKEKGEAGQISYALKRI